MIEIIYAVYGSNLLKERFMAYINGGIYDGRHYAGCKDKKKPEDLGYTFVPYRLYFAKESSRWDGKGVAFLTCKEKENDEYHTLVRRWKITDDQFKDIWKQEGKTYYHVKIYLGKKDGIEIYTLTGCWLKEKNKPGEKYLHYIKCGLKETTGWPYEKIEQYISKFLGKGDADVSKT